MQCCMGTGEVSRPRRRRRAGGRSWPLARIAIRPFVVTAFVRQERMMRRLLSLCLLLILSAKVTAREALISVIPKPVTMRTGEGAFRLTPQTKIVVEAGSAELRDIGRRLAEKLAVAAGHKIATDELRGGEPLGNTVLLTLSSTVENLGEEGYQLQVT